MSTEALTVVGLLQKGDEEFDSLIKAMPIKSLMDVISGLQKEMAKEQESFNSLSGELQNRKEKNSRQSKQISKDMMMSQQRLTLLMNRSMKCFSQQNVAASKGTQLKRRNSAKGFQPVIAPAENSPATNLNRSRSMHSVNQGDELAPISNSNNKSNLKPSGLVGARRQFLTKTNSNSSASTSSSITTGGANQHAPVIMQPSLNVGAASRNTIANTPSTKFGKSSGSSNNDSNTSVQTTSDNTITGDSRVPNGKLVGGGDGNKTDSTTTSSSSFSSSSSPSTTSTISETGSGLYIKRKQKALSMAPVSNFSTSSHTQNATSASQNSASTSNATASLPPKVPSSNSSTYSSSSSTSSHSSSTSSNTPSKLSSSSFLSSSSGRVKVLQTSKPSAPISSNAFSISNPLLTALSRPGLSKSQIIPRPGKDMISETMSHQPPSPSASPSSSFSSSPSSTTTATTADDFRGMPSVKMLAKSFGSNTALHTITNNSSTSAAPQFARRLSPAVRGVSRSSSSVCFGQTKNPHLNFNVPSNNIVYLTKANPGGENSSVKATNGIGSGKIQQPQQMQYNNIVNSDINTIRQNNKPGQNTATNSILKQPPQSTTETPPVANGGTSELETARSRLKSNRNSKDIREPSAETGPTGAIPNNDTVGSFNPSSTVISKTSSNSSNNNKINSNISLSFSTTLPSTNIDDVISAGTKSNSNSTKSNEEQLPQNESKDTYSKQQQQENAARAGGYIKKSGVQGTRNQPKILNAGSTAMPSSSSTILSSSSSTTPASKTNLSSSSSTSRTTATLTLAPPDPGAMRRSKSREELQSLNKMATASTAAPVPDRMGLMKQIEARRAEPNTEDPRSDASGSNFKSMAKLSRSMPSLFGPDSIFNPPTYGSGTKDDPIKSSVVIPETKPGITEDMVDGGVDEKTKPRMNLRDWDPSPVISDLYQVKMMEEVVEDISHQYVSMEGLMEKLPMNKKKATLLKTWKRRFFKAHDGWLYYYESGGRDRPSETIQLMGGAIHDLGNRILGIDDGRGRYLMVRCPTEKEYGQWKVALESQTADNTKATYVVPLLASPKNPSKNVVVIDLGSSAIRAGILGEKAALPELFFPSLVAVDKTTGQIVAVGKEASKPDIRQRCDIIQPIRPSNKVDQFNIDVQLLEPLFSKIFQDLSVRPDDYMVMLCTPQNLGDPLKKGLMDILVSKMGVKAVCMVQQALLSLYSYNATSGIIVDIGHRLEILPIFDGFVIEGGVARCPFGGQKVQEALSTALLGNNYKLVSPTEQWLVRYVMEKSCYVASVYAQEEEWCLDKPQTIRANVKLNKFHLPENAYQSVSHDLSRFKSPEGFFNVDLWEMDYPTLQKLVHQAIQTCPMDNRRHMWRAIFLSGGVSMLPGFAERLEGELVKLAPPGVPVEVHAMPQRYHAAYIGACSVALMPQFVGMAISKEEWKSAGVKTFKKWKT